MKFCNPAGQKFYYQKINSLYWLQNPCRWQINIRHRHRCEPQTSFIVETGYKLKYLFTVFNSKIFFYTIFNPRQFFNQPVFSKKWIVSKMSKWKTSHLVGWSFCFMVVGKKLYIRDFDQVSADSSYRYSPWLREVSRPEYWNFIRYNWAICVL